MGSPFTTTIAAAMFAVGSLSVNAWTPGVGSESSTAGFSVDTQMRNDVVSFWHNVYMASEGYEDRINWTGSVGSSSPDTTSAAFKDDVQRRINYYRAMAGMTADIDMTSTATVELGGSTPAAAKPSASATKASAAQAAALMRSANSARSEDPHNAPSNWTLDDAIARNGAYHSSLSLGHYGPGAIDAYMSDDDVGTGGSANDDVAHRRYLIYSRIQEVATGDVTKSGNYLDANALYVSGNLLTSYTAQFIPWPNAGFIPEPIVPDRWSLSYPGADFSSATVTMTDIDDNPVPLTIVSKTANFADKTIVWKPNPGAIDTAAHDDLPFNVTVSNINVGGTMVSHSYQVVIINPNRLLDSTDLSGSTSPPDSGANYFFNPVVQAEEYELDVSTLETAAWFEGAEDGTDGLIADNTDTTYDLRTAHSWNGHQFWDTGSKAFRLTFPRQEFDAEQSFIIDRTIIPRASASLTFRMRRGYMASDSRLAVQSSVNGGEWTTLQDYAGTNNIDGSFSTQTISLPDTDQNTQIRFILHLPANNGTMFDLERYGSFPIGIFIDGIVPVNCDVLESLPTTSFGPSSSFVTLNSTTGGGPLNVGQNYILRMRARMGDHWFSYGSSYEVTPVAAASLSDYELWFRGQYAIVGSFTDDFDQDGLPNAVERIFGLSPVDGSDASSALTPQISGGNIQLSHPIISGATIEAEYSSSLQDDSWLPATVNISGGIATASVPITSGAQFIRWKVAP